ncbi:MAG TPA: hypothetical protein P5096_01280 [Patescibacteria group bacterium]|nr:hypothetical protein [Patescibacteria group bacterium]
MYNKKNIFKADCLSVWSENYGWVMIPLSILTAGSLVLPSACDDSFGCIDRFHIPTTITFEQQPSSGLATSNDSYRMMPIIVNNVTSTTTSGYMPTDFDSSIK